MLQFVVALLNDKNVDPGKLWIDRDYFKEYIVFKQCARKVQEP
jgi:hypothetical protein